MTRRTSKSKPSLSGFLLLVIEKISSPSDKIEREEPKRQARLLAALLFVLMILTLVGTITQWILGVSTARAMVLTTILVWISYGIARTRYYWIGGILSILVTTIPSFYSFGTSNGQDYFFTNYVMVWLAVPLVLSSLILPTLQCIAINSVIIIVLFNFHFFFDHLGFEHLRRAFSFLSVLFGITVMASLMYKRSRSAIRNQFAKREQIEEELKKAKEGLEASVLERTKELRETNDTLQALVESSPAAVIAVDKNNHVTLWNSAAQHIFGWKESEILGKKNPIFPAGPEDKQNGPFGLKREESLGGSRELTVQTKDKASVHVSLSTAPLQNISGETGGIIGVLIDQSEQKRLEQQFRQAQKMEAVGQLAGGVAHDFNNLLTIINGYTESLMEQLQRTDPIREDLLEINQAGVRASKLTRQLLAFGRRQVFKTEILDLNEVIDGMGKMLRRILGENIVVELRLSSKLASVEADPGQIEQVIMNLVVNARDAMPTGGTLRIETSNVELKSMDGLNHHEAVRLRNTVMFSVSDTGIGIKKKIKEKLFEPFFTTKGLGYGTGLGLSTVYGIVTQSKGAIKVSNNEAQGSTFAIYLPQTTKSQMLRHTSEPSILPAGSESILVIEDEVGVRNLVKRLLTKLGYTVHLAPNGLEAVQVVQNMSEPIDLILTDVVMPHMSGPESLKYIREIRKDFKVLFMSGHDDEQLEGHGAPSRETGLLQKPFTSEQLAQEVRNILDS